MCKYFCSGGLMYVVEICLRMFVFFFQAEDGIRVLVRSRGLGDVYKRQVGCWPLVRSSSAGWWYFPWRFPVRVARSRSSFPPCLLYTSDAADDLLCVDLGGRRIIKKKKIKHTNISFPNTHPTLQPPILNQQ